MRKINRLDRLLIEADATLRTLKAPKTRECTRDNPAAFIPNSQLSPSEKKHVAGLMRVNHAGEVCAQALYRGQALTAKLDTIRDQMNEAAAEEIDHLAWCETRLQELNSKPSMLNPFWYAGSWLIGAFAGLIGDKWSLGFVAETERQVTAHLEQHLKRLPASDQRTHAILSQMKADEIAHAELAHDSGAANLPPLIQRLMYAISKVLTSSSYHL
ncbi:MAG: 2-polyprenyl-3-methyl-6-methoxy-1,4-benzoquinone monooxygenase [Gammaproteobacteria bacterium]|nr:2-polyprenyl-3-methyl-6-methoxy-1,4-benzoquinone monooxygenase [Gammaproteobacteria bacterium]